MPSTSTIPNISSLHPLVSPTWSSDCSLFADNDYKIPIPGIRSCNFLTSADTRIAFPGSKFFNSGSSDLNNPFSLPFLNRPENQLVIIPETGFTYNEIFIRIRNLRLSFELFDKSDVLSENVKFYSSFESILDTIDFTDQTSLER